MGADSRVILWDFDGTLCRADGLWRSALMVALDEQLAGHGVTSDELRPHFRDGFPWHRPDVAHPELSDPEAWWAEVGGLFARAGKAVGLSEDVAVPLARRARQVVIDPSSYELFDDVRPALTALRGRGWRHLILSNHVPELADIVCGLGIADLFEAVLTSALIDYEKPHPEAFRLALEKAGQPEVVWMVGDNVQADIAGAEAAGVPAILIRQDGQAKRRAADCWDVAEIVG
ncbi:MAG: HAD-IA family hydrolase [Armatimonadetes bacterium]|nr:HAD-IA family hydrolase [Armatimonadota bacterium]